MLIACLILYGDLTMKWRTISAYTDRDKAGNIGLLVATIQFGMFLAVGAVVS